MTDSNRQSSGSAGGQPDSEERDKWAAFGIADGDLVHGVERLREDARRRGAERVAVFQDRF